MLGSQVVPAAPQPGLAPESVNHGVHAKRAAEALGVHPKYIYQLLKDLESP